MLVTVWAIVVWPAAASAGPPDPCADMGVELIQRLTAVYRSQQPDGDFDLGGPNAFLAEYPLLATMSRDANAYQSSPAFLSQSAASISRYYRHLFGKHDANGNLLLESTIVDRAGTRVDVEDVGTNSLVALDIVNLARLYLELRKPARALYWYEGSRTLQRNIADLCFDRDTGYFFPRAYSTGGIVRNYYALSALPALFHGMVGENHTNTLVSQYLLKDANRLPESPSQWLGPANVSEGEDAARIVREGGLARTLALLDVLRESGNNREAAQFARDAVANLERLDAVAPPPNVYARYLTCLLRSERKNWLNTAGIELDIFASLLRSKRRLPDAEIVRVERSLADVRRLLTPGFNEEVDLAAMNASLRNIYGAISKTRDQIRAQNFFTREDAYDMNGMDPVPPMENLFDDVTACLREAENRLFEQRWRKAGFYVSATLLDETPVVGRDIEWKWVLGSLVEPVEIRSAVVYVGAQADSVVRVGEPITISPGDEPRTLTSRVRAAGDRPESIESLTATIVMEDSQGRRSRFNVTRSIYLQQPVSLTAEFPEGQLMNGTAVVPIRIKVVKRVPAQLTIAMTWYCTSGVKLKEGNSLEFSLEIPQDSASVTVNAIVPNPSRPGLFPFKIAFRGNGGDLGTISSALFKPYQWLFVGPFPTSEDPMAQRYEPEQKVNLLKAYPGQGRMINWQSVPVALHSNGGELALRQWGKQSGVGYLYTVVQSSYPQKVPAVLWSNTEAALYINGKRVLQGPRPGDHRPTTGRIQLKESLNEILIKVNGDNTSNVYFHLGDEQNLAPDEFNNNLWELVDGFKEFYDRSQRQLASGGEAQKVVTLRFKDGSANSVSVIGSFNGWSPEHSRMRKVGKDTWEINISLPPGKYTYRFLINNRKQVLDPSTDFSEPDGYGGRNSVLFVKK